MPEDNAGQSQDCCGMVQIEIALNKQWYGPYSTDIRTTRAIWEGRKNRKLSAESRELIKALVKYEETIEAAHSIMVKEEMVIDGEAIIKSVRSGDLTGSNATLAQVYGEFMKAKKAVVVSDRRKRADSQIAPATYETYRTRWTMIQGYLAHIKRPHLPVRAIKYEFATNLAEWFIMQKRANGQPYSVIYANKIIRLAKQLMTYALSKGYIGHSPLDSFACRGSSIANPKPLTKEQIDQLENCDLPSILRHACDSWIVAGELCLHHADFSELPKIKFIQVDELRFIQHDRSKQTGSRLIQTVNVTERAERILAKWGGPKGLYYNSSAYYSKLLKQIARLADLRDGNGDIIPLQFGQGRDSGLTQRAIDGANGIQLSKMAGWSKPVYAERYIGNPLGIVEAFAKSIQPKKPEPVDPERSQPFIRIHKTV